MGICFKFPPLFSPSQTTAFHLAARSIYRHSRSRNIDVHVRTLMIFLSKEQSISSKIKMHMYRASMGIPQGSGSLVVKMVDLLVGRLWV